MSKTFLYITKHGNHYESDTLTDKTYKDALRRFEEDYDGYDAFELVEAEKVFNLLREARLEEKSQK